MEGASVVVVTAAAGAVDVVDELAAEDSADEVVVEEEDDVVVVARFTEVEVVDSRGLEAVLSSMTPVSRNPMNAPAPTMARRTSPAANLLILVLLSNSPLVDTHND